MNDTKPKIIEIESLIVNSEDYMKDIIFNLIGGIIFLIMSYNYFRVNCNIVNKLMIKKQGKL